MGLLITTKARVADLNDTVKLLVKQKDNLQDQCSALKVEVRELKLAKKIEIEDIQHMIKIKEEKLDIAYEKKALKLEQDFDKRVATVKNEYRDKVEENLEKSRIEMRGMYSEVLLRLPDVNVALKGKT